MLGRLVSVALLLAASFAALPVLAEEDGLEIDTPDIEPGESWGGPFGAFESSDPISKFEGRLIDTLDPALFERSPSSAPPYQSGLLLARREAFGRDMVPVPLVRVERLGEEIVTRLLEGARITGLTPKIVVLAAEAIHGEALPDGTIFITLGAVRNIDTIDTFAALLAHEVSHIILNHHDSDWFLESQERGLAATQLALAMKENLEKEFGSRGDAFENLKIRLIANAVVFTSDVFIDSSFTRAQEDQADILASDLLVKAGFNLEGLSALLEMIADQEKLSLEAAERQEAERQRAVGEEIEQRGVGGFFQSLTGVAEEAYLAVSRGLRQAFGKRHRSAEERRENIVKYWDREYPNVDAIPTGHDDWATLRQQGKLVSALDAYRDVLGARLAILTQELDGVVEQIGRALKTLPADHALPRIVAAELSAAAGDRALAELYFQQALQGRNPPLSAYAELLELRRTMRQSSGVAKIIANAQSELEDPPQFLPDRIVYLKAAPAASQKTAAVEISSLLAECRLTAIKSLFEQCSRAAKGNFRRLPRILRRRHDLNLAGLTSGDVHFVRIARPKVNARSGPGTRFEIIAAFKQGTALMVINTDGKWKQVRDREGRMSWVAGWLTANAPEAREKFFSASGATAPSRKRPVPSSPPSTASAPAKRNAPPPAAGDADNKDVVNRLRKLKALHDDGLITDGEYKSKRAEILKDL